MFNTIEKISIDQILGSNYIRYDRLVDMVNTAFVGSSADTVNMYIDLYSMLKPLYNNQNYNIEDYSKVTSNIINICAHYREFFRTRYRVESRFFLVYSKNTPYINKQFYPEYNSGNESSFNTNKLVDDMISNNISLLETICPYLPDIFFIKGDFETSVIIYDLICRVETLDKVSPHIVLTKDKYAYQLIPTRDNVLIFRPKKNKGLDMSYFINKGNLISTYMNDRKVKFDESYMSIMPEMLTLMMGLSSVKERNIKTLLNIKSTMKIINDAIKEYKLLNGYNTIETLWNSIDNSKIKLSQQSFEYRMKAIDIIFQHSIYINTPECKNVKCTNLYDPETVKEINNKYFISNPLDLDRL